MAMSTVSRPLYRARQFVAALHPRLDAAERDEARALLGERLFALFGSMERRDQRHCLDVYRRLGDSGCADADLLAAALLHDAGKGRLAGPRVRLWQRVVYVLLEAASTGVLERAGGGLGVLHRHAEVGAELAAAAGASPAVVEMIGEHERREGQDERQRQLRHADDVS